MLKDNNCYGRETRLGSESSGEEETVIYMEW